MRAWLAQRKDGPPVLLTSGDGLGAFSGDYDLFAVTASPDGKAADLKGSKRIHSRALLAPNGSGIEAISSQWVVSYGMALRNSLTISSLEPDSAVLALQRELPTLTGTVVERQELPLPIPPGTGADTVMALYGSLLLLGIPPDALVSIV